MASPTPEEIKERSAEVRKTWSTRETYRRAGMSKPPRWTVPTVETTERREVADEDA